MAAQLTGMKGPSLRELRRWIAGHQLLLRAALAVDQHGEIGGRGALGHVDDALEGPALPDKLLEAAGPLPSRST
jgi:hypothetical protein